MSQSYWWELEPPLFWASLRCLPWLPSWFWSWHLHLISTAWRKAARCSAENRFVSFWKTKFFQIKKYALAQENQPKEIREHDLPSVKATKSDQHASGPDADMLLVPTSLQACAIFQKHKDTRCHADHPLKICGKATKFPGVPQSLQSLYNRMDISRHVLFPRSSSGHMTHGMCTVIVCK